MRKILLIFSLCLLCLPSVNFANAESEKEYICIANSCYLYTSPSLGVNNMSEIMVKHKDILTLEEDESGNLKVYDSFYSVLSVNGKTTSGYIFSQFVVENSSGIETYPTFNATLKNDTNLYEINGEEFTETDIALEKGTRVFLYEGFDNDITGYNAVAVKIGNELLYGYVLKSEVAPDGINPAIIYAITIALACIGIIMAFLFMKNKKKKNGT